MIYSEFTFEQAKELLGLETKRANLFTNYSTIEAGDFIKETLSRGLDMPLINEKVRSEVLISPLLLEIKKLNQYHISVISGASLNVDKEKSLMGKCYFLIANKPDLENIDAPLFVLMEAKHQNIEGGLGQAMAQMYACKLFNDNKNYSLNTIFGCITTGILWQFLKLEDNMVYIDKEIYFLKNELDKILGIFQYIVDFQK